LRALLWLECSDEAAIQKVCAEPAAHHLRVLLWLEAGALHHLRVLLWLEAGALLWLEGAPVAGAPPAPTPLCAEADRLPPAAHHLKSFQTACCCT
jgi:hypothetical protein